MVSQWVATMPFSENKRKLVAWLVIGHQNDSNFPVVAKRLKLKIAQAELLQLTFRWFLAEKVYDRKCFHFLILVLETSSLGV